MTAPDRIVRFYKPTAENIEAIEKSFIYLFSAKEWKDQTEMQFEVDTSDPDVLKQFVTKEVAKAFSFAKGSNEYIRYFGYRYDLLSRHGRINMLGTAEEKEHLVELSLKEITSEKIKGNKKGLVRSNFFSSTGISCLTADLNTIEDPFHWAAFAESGEGFCAEYDWAMLQQYFANTKAGIRGDFVKYYERNKPKLILQSDYSQIVMDNYFEVIFSLGQLMQDEKEFRLAKVYKEDLPDKDDRRKQPIPEAAIKTIIFGSTMTRENRAKLINIVNRKVPSIELMKIERSDVACKKFPFPG